MSVNDDFEGNFEGTSFSNDGIAFGGGVQYFFTPKNGIRLEYTHCDFESGFGNAEIYSVSYVRNF